MHIDQKKVIELQPGKYVMRVKTPWKNKDESDFVITTYSDQEVFLDYHLNKEKNSRFLEKFYLDIARDMGDKYLQGKECYFASGWEGNHLWIYMQNDSSDKTWDLEINFKKMENMRMSKRYKLEDTAFKVQLGPKTDKIAYLKRSGTDKTAIDWTFKNNWV